MHYLSSRVPCSVRVGPSRHSRARAASSPRTAGVGPPADDVIEARKLAQRANRANVSVYPIDPAGLGMGPTLTTSATEQERSAARQSGLRELAAQTDGTAVLLADEVTDGAERLRADLRPYYVLSYYSSNRSLDGRFRRVSVRVKREGVEVRTRPGYLSMSETEARAHGIVPPSPPGNRPPPAVARPTDRSTPTGRPLAAQIQATGDVGRIKRHSRGRRCNALAR